MQTGNAVCAGSPVSLPLDQVGLPLPEQLPANHSYKQTISTVGLVPTWQHHTRFELTVVTEATLSALAFLCSAATFRVAT